MSVTLAADYACLILSDAKKDIDASNIITLAKAAGITIPQYVADIYAATVAKKPVSELTTVSASAAPAAAAAPVAAAAAPKKEEKKVEEKKEESDDDMGMGLFD